MCPCHSVPGGRSEDNLLCIPGYLVHKHLESPASQPAVETQIIEAHYPIWDLGIELHGQQSRHPLGHLPSQKVFKDFALNPKSKFFLFNQVLSSHVIPPPGGSMESQV